MAVRKRPAACGGFDGNTMRMPGQCAKMLSPDCEWHGAPPRRYPPIAVRITIGHEKALFERYRSIAISSRIGIIAGQLQPKNWISTPALTPPTALPPAGP